MTKYKRYLIIALFSTFFYFIILSPIAICQPSEFRRVVIIGDDYSEEFQNISDAIQYAIGGSTIYVESGIFIENIVIDKPIRLIGNNNSIIDGSGRDYVFLIESCCVEISNIAIRNATFGIYAKKSNIIIKNNLFSNNSNGIFLNNLSYKNIIKNNYFISNSEAINLYNSSNNNITGNHFDKNSFFSLKLIEGSKNNVIFNNTILSGKNGIILSRWSNNNSIFHNNITTDSWGIGISCEHSFFINIQENYFTNWTYAIKIMKCDNIILKNNSFIKNNVGVFLSDDNLNITYNNNYFFKNIEDIKTESKPPLIKTPSFEITILIVVAFAVLLVFFFKPKK